MLGATVRGEARVVTPPSDVESDGPVNEPPICPFHEPHNITRCSR